MGLESWLRQATRCLASDSVARVRAEIQEHYQLAREAAMINGATSEEADILSLGALGDAKTANRQYRRVLLTAGEARILRESNWEGLAVCSRPWLKWLMLAAPVVAVAVATGLWFRGQEAARDVLIVAMGMSPLLAAPLLPIYTPSRGLIFRYVKWVAIIGMFALVYGTETLRWSWLLISCLWPMAASEWTRHSIRRKLPVSHWPKHLYL
jgi:hypothetical protein